MRYKLSKDWCRELKKNLDCVDPADREWIERACTTGVDTEKDIV